ncbi:MAG: hypothetical protein NVS2B15_20100 [Pseudarthrobacter sp.]
MRGELLDLHQLAMEAYPNGSKEDLIKLYEDAEDLESTAFELMEQAEKLHQVLLSLMATEPEDLRDYRTDWFSSVSYTSTSGVGL